MLNRRSMPYIVGVCVAGLLFVCYISYREYQRHVAFERFISGAEAFNHSVEHTDQDEHIHLTEAHTHTGGNPDLSITADTTNPYYKGKRGDEYVYMVAGKYIYTPEPFDQESLELEAWEITGEKTPYVEKHLKWLAEKSPYKGQVVQRIVTPDGQLHNVIVPHDRQYEEGDAILRSELNPPILEAFDQPPGKIEVVGKPIPDEYYAIEDPYERAEFLKKVGLSRLLKISMAEIEAKIAKGEIDASLTAKQKENVDKKLAMEERRRMLNSFAKPVPSDKSPVKVSFLSDTAEDALPGWMRKLEGTLPSGSSETVSDGVYSATDTFSEGSLPLDTETDPVGSEVPLSPSDLPHMVKPQSSPGVADLQRQLTPAGIEAQLPEGLSPERFSKAQKLIDQYGTEEGLRRLREVDPEAARQFESDKSRPGRERLRSESPRPSELSSNAPDGEQSER